MKKLAPHIAKIKAGYAGTFTGKRAKDPDAACPFCGNADGLRVIEVGAETYEWAVLCPNCGALGPVTDTQEKARETWAGRKP